MASRRHIISEEHQVKLVGIRTFRILTTWRNLRNQIARVSVTLWGEAFPVGHLLNTRDYTIADAHMKLNLLEVTQCSGITEDAMYHREGVVRHKNR